MRGGGVNRQTTMVSKKSANKIIRDTTLGIWSIKCTGKIKVSSSIIERNGIRRINLRCGINRQITIVRGIPTNKAANDAKLARGEIKEISGNTTARNGIARRKRLRGVDCQTTTASGIPANNTTPNASVAPARTTCPASMKSDCAAIASFAAEILQ